MCVYKQFTVYAVYIVGWVRGVTQLGNIVYIVCNKSPTIDVYSADTLSPLGEGVDVEEMIHPKDIVACHSDRQLYVADWNCIWRVSADDHSYVKWLTIESTTDRFHDYWLSVTSQRLLVTSSQPPSLRQYSTIDRRLLRVVPLPECVEKLYHAVETTRQTFVVCHQGTSQNSQQYAVSDLFSNACKII